MTGNTVTFEVRTVSRLEMVDITQEVRGAVASAGVTDGTCLVYVPHTTAGITINEGADPDVASDILDTLERVIPSQGPYRHAEGNAAAHVKASLVGSSVQVVVERAKVVLGTWQAIFFCEFDGPRSRRVHVSVG